MERKLRKAQFTDDEQRRLPAYEPRRHLGGVLYLFVRGMCGPATPVVDGLPTGGFSWRPSAALVIALSDLLSEGRPAA